MMSGRAEGMRDDYNAGGAGAPWWRRGWVWAVVLGVGGFVLVHGQDLAIFEAARALEKKLPSDLRREWFGWQQYGQGVAIGVTALLVWVLAPARRRRLLDLGLALAIAQVASSAGKMLIGRPRPRDAVMDPNSIPGPWGVYPIRVNGEWRLVHGWETSLGANADVWSMPSSHALFAAMLSAWLGMVWPRGRWVFAVLAVLVGLGRVVFGAHWPSDVVVGWAAGWAIGDVVTRNGLGVRLLDWVWVRFVDRGATPSWPGIVRDQVTGSR